MKKMTLWMLCILYIYIRLSEMRKKKAVKRDTQWRGGSSCLIFRPSGISNVRNAVPCRHRGVDGFVLATQYWEFVSACIVLFSVSGFVCVPKFLLPCFFSLETGRIYCDESSLSLRDLFSSRSSKAVGHRNNCFCAAGFVETTFPFRSFPPSAFANDAGHHLAACRLQVGRCT